MIIDHSATRPSDPTNMSAFPEQWAVANNGDGGLRRHGRPGVHRRQLFSNPVQLKHWNLWLYMFFIVAKCSFFVNFLFRIGFISFFRQNSSTGYGKVVPNDGRKCLTDSRGDMRWFFKCSICHWRWELWLAKEAKLLSGTTFAKTQGIRNRVRRVLLQTMGLGEMETKVRQLCKHLHLSSLMKLQISKKGWNLIKTNCVLINHQTEFINPSTETGQHNRSLVTEQLMIMQDAKCVIVINAVD